MGSQSLSALVPALALVLILAPALPALAVDVPVYSFDDLLSALNLANDNSKACNSTPGCLGQVVTAQLNVDIYLPQALPGLFANAHLVLTGNCPARKGNSDIDSGLLPVTFHGGLTSIESGPLETFSPFTLPSSQRPTAQEAQGIRSCVGASCLFDGQNQFKIFSSAIPAMNSGVSCQLEMYGLIFQRANGGVITSTYCVVIAEKSIFRNNIGGVVKSLGFFGGAPQQTFVNCGFFANNGTAIQAGNGKLGLAANGGVAFIFRRIIFRNNLGGMGGAVSLAGYGTSIFEEVYFANNVAADGGGAVFADQTHVIFRVVNFTANTAQGSTGGGAVLGQCSTYQNTSISFCSSSFTDNSAPANLATDSLLFRTYTFPNPRNRVDVHFCDTVIPTGAVFTEEPNGSVTNGTGSSCADNYC